ncbi:MAG: DMT family transporter [Chloroflexota bacterium]
MSTGSAPLARGLVYVGIAVFFFATSPVLARWAAPLTAFEITFGRMAVAAVAVLFYIGVRRERVVLARRDLPAFVLYGLVTALHFLLYIASLGYTTIAHSLALVYTSPIFVTIFAALFLGERIVRRQYAGLAVAIAGVALLTGFEPTMTPTMAFGDLLAVGSAICFGIYSVIGRRERGRYPLLSYALGVYAMAALWLAPTALAAPTTAGAGWGAILSVIALGVFPLGLGHTLYNASLRRVHPTYVNLIATQEVTGGVILGYLFLDEVPSTIAVVGATMTLAGIAIVLLFRREETAAVE